MLIPRSGYSGLILYLINKPYNTVSEKHHLYADKVFDVPFVGQNHANMCVDASLAMLYRWAKVAMPGMYNLTYQCAEFSNLGKFLKTVAAFKKKSRDKLRDEAVKVFDKYLNPEFTQSSDNILRFCKIEPLSIEFLELFDKIEACREMKMKRDMEFKGLSNRWARHKSKAQGYVVDHSLFDKLLEAIQMAYFSGQSVAEFITNPRLTPLSGLTYDDIDANHLGFLDWLELQRPTTFEEFSLALDSYGPLIALRISFRSPFGMNVSHAIVITGYVRSSQYLIYHDPWTGPNKRVLYGEIYENLCKYLYGVKPEFIPDNSGIV